MQAATSITSPRRSSARERLLRYQLGAGRAAKQTPEAGKKAKSPKRFYSDASVLADYAFRPGTRYRIEYERLRVTLSVREDGERQVSKRGKLPVIDIENTRLAESLGAVDAVDVRLSEGRIILTPTQEVLHVLERPEQGTGTEMSFFSGIGVLSESARLAGFEPVAGVEFDYDFASIFHKNHPNAVLYNLPIQALPWVELMQRFRGKVELLTLGLPCEPFSRVRHMERGTGRKLEKHEKRPANHEHGSLFVSALIGAAVVNPRTLLIEEVPGFLKSDEFLHLRRTLTDMRYVVDARVMNPLDFGFLTKRERAVIVATTEQAVRWPRPLALTMHTRVGDIFDPWDEVKNSFWTPQTKKWWGNWRESTRKKGSGYESGIYFDGSEPYVTTFTKRYLSQRGGSQVIRHPELEEHFRWFTLSELRRIHAIPDSYELGDAQTVAGEGICQAVHCGLFKRVIEAVTGRLPEHALEPLPKSAGAEDGSAHDSVEPPQLSFFEWVGAA